MCFQMYIQRKWTKPWTKMMFFFTAIKIPFFFIWVIIFYIRTFKNILVLSHTIIKTGVSKYEVLHLKKNVISDVTSVTSRTHDFYRWIMNVLGSKKSWCMYKYQNIIFLIIRAQTFLFCRDCSTGTPKNQGPIFLYTK